MPGIGSILSSITILKNNRRKKGSKLEKFSQTTTSKFQNTRTHHNTKKATPEQLKAIRERLQAENKKRKKQQIILVFLSLVILLALFNFLNHL
ncbi:hypothetical protein ACFS5J_02165 [Flavobacterium chuncheonense]|uniref:Uncharacterized protein n=1 Tax=Flavobacterium chuncheonense TaxID=2026653 RepID=A0ABW5YIK8_9FLAO